MQRSFTDRVLGGVCGGLGAALHVNAWLVRFVFVVLAIASLGVFAVLYLLLWWITPQQSFIIRRRRSLPVLLVLILIAGTLAAWFARSTGTFISPTGVDLFWPGALLLLSLVFFLRQVRV